ncbi:MAG: D-isomer specific 2-hydroxyacid dehydrogenase family protein [Nitriliruptorales bacterium]|nr:D-isomer specific 2-hydroxyacid dehydrogenase family protein [Nitriliruptorales bacterium]
MTAPRCAVEPSGRRPWLADAVRRGGGEVVAPGDAEAIVWADPKDADGLRRLLEEHPDIEWVQLPWAGIEPFVEVLDHDHRWTCGKGVYAEPVAEHALALALTGMRGVGEYATRQGWSAPQGRNLIGANVTVLGGGGIAREFLRLLEPFDARATVVRNRPDDLEGAARVVGPDGLHAALSDADLVVLALALTPDTTHIIDADALERLPDHAWIVNVARGRHIATDALVDALRSGSIGGAGLDVTDPEPLPDGHPLWELPNAIITPHVGNTPEMAVPLLSRRVTENVRRYAAGEPLLGPVHVDLGY